MSRSGLRFSLLAGGVVSLSLFASGCGGSSASHVAQLGPTSTTTQDSRSSTGSGGAATAGGSITSQALAYARCMRSHDVPTFPDPDSSGQIPKTQVVNARKGNPSRFDSANTACRHLLPSGGSNGETPAQIAQDWTHFRTFARCMRSHGVANFPDPTRRSTSDNRPDFNLTAVGLGNSPQLKAKAQQCASLLHLGGLPAAH